MSSLEELTSAIKKQCNDYGKASVERVCKKLNITFTIKEDAMFSEFDRALNNDVPLRYSNTAIAFIEACFDRGVRISEVQVLFGGYKFLFKDSVGDAIIHKFSDGADEGYLETMGFEFDDGDVSTNTAADLAELIAVEVGNERVSED